MMSNEEAFDQLNARLEIALARIALAEAEREGKQQIAAAERGLAKIEATARLAEGALAAERQRDAMTAAAKQIDDATGKIKDSFAMMIRRVKKATAAMDGVAEDALVDAAQAHADAAGRAAVKKAEATTQYRGSGLTLTINPVPLRTRLRWVLRWPPKSLYSGPFFKTIEPDVRRLLEIALRERIVAGADRIGVEHIRTALKRL